MKKIVFVSSYYEVLKTLDPLIKHFNKEFEVYVLASCIPVGNDFDKCKSLLNKLEVAHKIWISKNPVDIEPLISDKSESPIDGVGYLYREKQYANKFIREFKPDILVVTADRREFEKYLVGAAHREKIPSICFHWSLGPITEKSFIENYYGIFYENFQSSQKSRSLLQNIVRLIFSSIYKLLRLNTPSYAKCFGGGDSDVLTAMGQGPKDFFVSQGIKSDKIKIVGSPLYERIYFTSSSHVLDSEIKLFDSLKIPKNNKIILYGTQYKKTRFYDHITEKEVFAYRKSKLEKILEAFPKVSIIVKLHPREKLESFEQLCEIDNRISVTRDIDLNALIPHCTAFISRASTSVIYALMRFKPVITFNYPRLPMGNFYKEIGGTLHVDSDSELLQTLNCILEDNKNTMSLINVRRQSFLKRHLNIMALPDGDFTQQLPSITKFEELIENLIKTNL